VSWAPRNLDRLTRLIREHGRGGASYDPARPPYAVFDWDQTSAFLDCEEVVFRFVLWNLELAYTPDELRAILRDSVNGTDRVLLTPGRYVALADVNRDILTAWSYLWPRLARHDGTPIERLRETPEFADLVTKLAFLYETYERTPSIGPDYAYRWILYVLAGRSIEDLRALCGRAFDAALAAPLARATWKGPRELGSRAGPIDYTFRTGLRVHPEMQDLYARLPASGIDLYVVTASLTDVVDVYATDPRYGYGLAKGHVIGCELEVRDTLLRPTYRSDWVLTYGPGKVEAIRRRLGARGDPILVAGDGDGDAEMLSELAGTQVSLILNRVMGGRIGSLCRCAVRDDPPGRYLLQGRDENTGRFLPGSATILFGEREARVLVS